MTFNPVKLLELERVVMKSIFVLHRGAVAIAQESHVSIFPAQLGLDFGHRSCDEVNVGDGKGGV